MSNYRRFKTSGGTYFFTVVTYNRQEILCKPQSRNALRDAIEAVRALLPFRIDAWVLLPDHLHCIWTLPEGDADFSKRWGIIKTSFTKKVVGWAMPTLLLSAFTFQLNAAISLSLLPDQIDMLY
jgi:putative transposase